VEILTIKLGEVTNEIETRKIGDYFIAWPRPDWYSENHCPGCWFYVGAVTNKIIEVDGVRKFSLKKEDEILFDHCKQGGCVKDWQWKKKGKKTVRERNHD
jgi:hypothetical protein